MSARSWAPATRAATAEGYSAAVERDGEAQRFLNQIMAQEQLAPRPLELLAA